MLPSSHLENQHHRLTRSYLLGLGFIGLLALASLGLLIAQIDSQGRYARMIDRRENQRVLTLRAAYLSLLLGAESDPARREQYRSTILSALDDINPPELSVSAGSPSTVPSPDATATDNLARQLAWFAVSERTILARTSLLAPNAGAPELGQLLATAPSTLRDAFDDAIESLRNASLRRTHLFQALASGVVCLLLLALVAEAAWIFRPLVHRVRRETRALAENRQRLNAVLDTVGEAIIVADEDNVIQTVNAEAARVWGCLPAELPGQKISALVLAGQELSPADWRAMFPVGGRLETVGTRRNGEPFGLELSLTSTHLAELGEDLGGRGPAPRLLFTMSARDITARLETARQLAAARDAALDAARAKGAFVANMSHEIRTPLNAIRETSSQLANTALDDEQRELLDQTLRHGEALSVALDDLLDFSNIESGKLILERVDFDLRKLVESAADVLAGRAVQKQLELLAFVEPGVPTALRGDPARLRQVLLNLLGNALKFTRRGDVILEVSLVAEEEDELTLRFAIRDTGPGIALEDQPRLFHAFSQGEELTDARGGGRGFGLMISRQLVERMGGNLEVESEPGKGSTFHFTTRLQKQLESSGSARPAELAEAQMIASLRDVRVLFVDDNAACRRLVNARLTAWGMIPAVAESGGAALVQLREQALAGTPFEVALLDLNLGSMDGFTLAWAIHSQPLLARTRIVLVTALGLENDRTAYLEVGILGSVSKPLKHSAVLQALANVVAQADALEAPTTLNSRPLTPPVRTNRISIVEAPIQTGGRRVLLADDNPINRKMALRQLANLGFPADAVTNGREALAALRAQPYGLVILDMHMPVMDGYETATTIRRVLRSQREDQLALIAMTANRTNGDRQRCLEAGMDDYLSKPVRQDELARMLERWNGTARYAEEAAAASARLTPEAEAAGDVAA